jgi:hypothetical protein
VIEGWREGEERILKSRPSLPLPPFLSSEAWWTACVAAWRRLRAYAESAGNATTNAEARSTNTTHSYHFHLLPLLSFYLLPYIHTASSHNLRFLTSTSPSPLLVALPSFSLLHLVAPASPSLPLDLVVLFNEFVCLKIFSENINCTFFCVGSFWCHINNGKPKLVCIT